MPRTGYKPLRPSDACTRKATGAGAVDVEEDEEHASFLPFALEPPAGARDVPRLGSWDTWTWLAQRKAQLLIGAAAVVLLAAAVALTAVLIVRHSRQSPDPMGRPAGPGVQPQWTASDDVPPASAQVPPGHSHRQPAPPSPPQPAAAAPARLLCPAAPAPGDTVFFIVGDWGRSGSPSQMKVAQMMAQLGDCMHPNFVVSTGDNFYPSGLSSPSGMVSSFSNVYTAPSLQIPWYAVLGNHDYGDGLDSDLLKGCHSGDASLPPEQRLLQCHKAESGNSSAGSSCCFSPLWQDAVRHSSSLFAAGALDPRWNLEQGAWQVKFSPDLTVTFIDTSPFISGYHKKHWAGLLGGISSRSSKTLLSQQKALIDQLLLQGSATPLSLVVGHHPIYSNGHKCHGKDSDKQECDDIAEWLDKLLRKHNALLYISGHEHDLQYIVRPEDAHAPHYVISGAGSDGSRAREDNPKHIHGQIWHDQGFVAAVVNGKRITLYYYISSSPAYVFNVTLG